MLWLNALIEFLSNWKKEKGSDPFSRVPCCVRGPQLAQGVQLRQG